MDGEKYKEHGKELLNYVTSYLSNIRSRKVLPDVKPGFMSELIPDRAPDNPDTWDDVMKDVERVIMPGVLHWQSPKFFAFWTIASSYPSMLADILSNGLGCLGFMWSSCPTSTELEVTMMDWLGKMLHLPESFLFSGPGKGGGVIQGNASEAILTCLLAARTLFFNKEKEKDVTVTLGQVQDRMVAYCSDQAHTSVEKAGLISGVRMRRLQTDEKGSLRGRTLKEAILRDKAERFLPIYLCATIGSTSTCAVDNLKELGPICQEHGMWMHADAAYAGSAFICPEFRPLLDGVEYAMSFNFNAHKWLKVMYECSPLWLRNTDHLRYAFDVNAAYLSEDNDVMPEFRHFQIAATAKPFRALKMWFVFRLFGVQGLQDYIRHDVRLAHEFEAMVKSDVRFEIVADVIMGLVCFRLKGPNERTEQLLKDLRADGKIHLVPSTEKDIFFLRLAICGPLTESCDITYAWDVIRQTADVIPMSNGTME